ncbi:hypothetical protein [Empedobacter tilapiae]
MKKTTQEIREEILKQTNGGLDIIMKYYPQARERQSFRIRPDDKTASASLKRLDDGNYIVTDWGDDSKGRNGVAIAAKEQGMTLYEATMMLANELGIVQSQAVLKPDIKQHSITEVDYKFEFEDKYHFEFSDDFEDSHLKILGPRVTKEICEKYKLFSVKFYATKKDGIVKEFYSTEHYPIFAFVNNHEKGDKKGQQWVKLYQPKSLDKAFRFRYINGKPKGFVFGLSLLKDKSEELYKPAKYNDEGKEIEPEVQGKIERVIICSGDRDSLNMASFGEYVVWLNSETEGISEAFFKKLAGMAENVINLPDLDTTGKRQGIEYALQHLDLKTAWLPDSLTNGSDFRGKSRKDFTDYCSFYSYNEWDLNRKVNLLLENALTIKFWTKSVSQQGNVNYYPSTTNIFYFLKCNGFYRIADENNDKGFVFVRIQDHLVSEIHPNEIKDFIQNYLEQKRNELGNKVIPKELLNKFYNPATLSEAIFSGINKTEFIPTRSNETTEFFHFSNQVWQIKADKIDLVDVKTIQTHVWDYKVLEKRVKKLYNKNLDSSKIFIDDDYFKISEDDNTFSIEVLENNCEFLNYLINTSRVYWEDEFVGLNDREHQEYFVANQFNISGKRLDPEQQSEQQLHLVNKLFSFGYLLHRFKLESRPWVVVMMDNEVALDDSSNGGTGKSIFTKAPRVFLETKEIEATVPNLFEDRFLYDGVTSQTDYILFDDADKRFQFRPLYAKTTGDFTVNPKNKSPFVIPFTDVAKFAVSTNFVINDNSPSTIRRTLEVTASNWYHAEDENGLNGYSPEDEFKHMLFSGWDINQWNKFFNLSAQCVKFYLSQSKKIPAPNKNVKKRKLISEMGPIFKEWADEFLLQYVYPIVSKMNNPIEKKVIIDHLKEYHKSFAPISSIMFTKKLNAWCQYNDIVLNPIEFPGVGKDGRLLRKINKSTIEYYYFYQPELTDEDNNDDDGIEYPNAGDWAKDDLDDFKV